ncbi:ABC transporter permease [Micromonospora sp. HM5-17]|jgi:peptide/nickel transport system permease protein|uniref:ABC transporter permease n=1 Tax=Micromonospora sp. HM5-17 TaxID=2487710 RepID=UPI000F48E2E1|nr:ABC transporter permease [Micromonospora sp. HM5-17]ROT32181.1 ABC transporter permease [Micromonospora sp. HM5-17]
MSAPTNPVDRDVAATRPAADDRQASDPQPDATFVGRSPGQLAWLRLRRDKVALVSGGVLIFFILVAAAAPLVEKLYGKGPQERFPELLDRNGFPLGYAGVSGEHWFGIQPGNGRDIFIQVVYGLRTSLMIAFTAAVLTIALGVVVGIVAGYVGGWVDAVITWIIDLALAFPFYIFCFAFVPLAVNQFYGPRDEVSPWFRPGLLVLIFVMFNWTTSARLVRGQVLSLREREFVEAARASGAGLGHILFRQLLPNLWAPILVTFSLNVPALITAEAALSFLGIGVLEPTPDLGRLINDSIRYLRDVPSFTIVGGTTLFLLVLAFNLFGDSLRDALDPKSSR